MTLRRYIDIVESATRITDTPEFKAWFADSKIVDEHGHPLVVYHGTRSDIHSFDASKSGEFGPGIYLTADNGTAYFYADNVARGDNGPNIMPLYASIQNPFRVTKTDWIKMTLRSTPRTVHKRLVAKGHDGIIGIGINGIDQQIVAFRPDQVKSAISNSGSFDTKSGIITEAVRPNYLYHGTTIDALYEILDSDVIEPKTGHRVNHSAAQDWALRHKDIDERGYISGVSLTRNPRFARQWATRKAPWKSEPLNGVVMVLDGEAIRRDFRIIPVAYWGGRDVKHHDHGAVDESEEFVVGPIKPITRYLVSVEVSQRALDSERLLADLPSLFGIKLVKISG